ncbi:MAG: hypothetical protein U5K38_05605 [Woeseiaceae bacterium]|nr:hypothetical protein [Woeseiaceae bacterium]
MQEKIALTAHQRKWLERLQACAASGKGFSEYAAEQGYPVRALYDAKKVLVKKGVLPRTQGNRFQRVQAQPEADTGEWRIQLPNGVSVAVWGAFDVTVLSAILSTVARLE